jgi:hypothetical protein
VSENDADEAQEASDRVSSWSSQADALFKELTREEAVALGLQPVETEFQHTTTLRADLVLSVPPGLNLEGTMFDFFRTLNVLEFKSQNDRFTLREFAKNDLRTDLQFLQGQDEDYENFLNVIVTSRTPRDFLSYAEKRGVIFRQSEGKPWLWTNQNGFQNIAIVACINLPLDKRYEDWLLFAPADSRKWERHIFNLAQRGDRRLLGLARKMRPKEFKMLTDEKYDEIIARVFGKPASSTPEEDVPITPQDLADFVLGRIEIDYPSVFDELADRVLDKLPPEKRVADLSPEERRNLLKQDLEELSPEERVAGLSPEKRLAGLSPEERVASLSPEELERLLKQKLEKSE